MNRTSCAKGNAPGRRCSRRGFLASAAGLSLAAAAMRAQAPREPRHYRVAVIGHTGRGNYGHGLDKVWQDVPGCEVVAVADANEKGLQAAVKRLKGAKGYADYRKMLEEARPDLVSVAPRWLDEHRDMVVAAAEREVRGIYLEKPMCRTLAEADEMVAACEKHKVKLAIAHQTRYSPKLPVIRDLIAQGRIGKVLEFRARGKEDRRGGGEDLWVLGTHVLDLIHALGGEPKWCSARVTEGGRAVAAKDVKPGEEGIGALAGDEVHALYGLAGGATAHFDSVRQSSSHLDRYGVRIHGSKGLIEIYHGYLPAAAILEDPAWSPARSRKEWVPISSAGIGLPEPLEDGGLHAGNVAAVKDLLSAIENDRQAAASVYTARTATEMIVAAFESHRTGGIVTFPLANRKNPLEMLT